MKINRIVFISSLVCVVFTLMSAQVFAGFFNKYDTVKPSGGEIQIPLSKVNDGEAHYFVYNGKKQVVKFFVVRSGDGVIRAAFDACDVCYHAKKGYSQDGDFMICNNCGRRFHSSRINVVKGGCNPAPLQRVERDGNLVIKVEDVLKGAMYF